MFLFCLTSVAGQGILPLFDVSFDTGRPLDLAQGQDGDAMGGEPICGVNNFGYSFDGEQDFMIFPTDVARYFASEFTFSFYLWIEPVDTDPVDIFSSRIDCERDNSFAIRYLPDINRVRVELSRDFSSLFEVAGALDPSKCWQFITITRSQGTLSIYVNNVLQDQERIDGTFAFNSPLVVSNSPCLDFTEVPFKGRLDELTIFDHAKSPEEIAGLDFRPDQIISNDTTIFRGEGVQILTGGTCGNFQWTPSSSVVTQNSDSPVVLPAETTVYQWRVNHGSCQSVDSIRVNVVTENDLSCGDLKMPTGFTPNNDGLNDNYQISNNFIIDNLEAFEIFNKWGGRVYFTNSKSDRWDGTFNGEQLNPGTFMYKVRYDCGDESFTKTGSFALIR